MFQGVINDWIAANAHQNEVAVNSSAKAHASRRKYSCFGEIVVSKFAAKISIRGFCGGYFGFIDAAILLHFGRHSRPSNSAAHLFEWSSKACPLFHFAFDAFVGTERRPFVAKGRTSMPTHQSHGLQVRFVFMHSQWFEPIELQEINSFLLLFLSQWFGRRTKPRIESGIDTDRMPRVVPSVAERRTEYRAWSVYIVFDSWASCSHQQSIGDSNKACGLLLHGTNSAAHQLRQSNRLAHWKFDLCVDGWFEFGKRTKALSQVWRQLVGVQSRISRTFPRHCWLTTHRQFR